MRIVPASTVTRQPGKVAALVEHGAADLSRKDAGCVRPASRLRAAQRQGVEAAKNDAGAAGTVSQKARDRGIELIQEPG